VTLTDPARTQVVSGGPDHGRALRRNVVVSTLGIVARSCQLILLFVIGRAFGADALGLFLLGFGLYEIVSAVVATGFTDGTMLFVSRRAGRAHVEGPGPLINIVTTALLVGGAVALGLAGLATVVVSLLEQRGAPVHPALLPGILWLAWALLPTLVARVCFAATSGLLRLEWEAIVGAAGPALAMLLAVPIVRATDAGLPGLFAAVFVVQVVNALLALVVLARRLVTTEGRGLLFALRHPRLDRALLGFALPQGLNMAAATYIARLDVLMLAALGTPAAVVGGYGTIAALVLELRQARMVLSGAFAPIVARYHADGDHAAIARILSRGASIAASIAVPLALGFVVVHGDVLALLAPGLRGNSRFVLVLLVGPLINCLGGLAGNFLVYLLRNRWNLANSILVALVHTLLCWILIPRFGLTGAAVSGAVAMTSVTLLENVEIAVLDHVHISPRALLPAGVTLALGGLVLAAGAPFAAWFSLGGRVAAAAGLALLAAAAIRPWSRRLSVPPRFGAAR
jgi:O-antigen/teichoic acid export membrane protein